MLLPSSPPRRNGAASSAFPPVTRLSEAISDQSAYHFVDREGGSGNPTISPLGICINTPAANEPTSAPSPTVVEALLTEIRLHAEKYGRRPVTQLMWRYPYSLAVASEVTEIIHNLSTRFRLNPSTPHEYCAEIDLLTITEEQVALLRGLGFNQILIRLCPGDVDPDWENIRAKLIRRTRGLRDYGFVCIGVKVCYGEARYGLHHQRRLLDIIIALRADRVILNDVSKGFQWDPPDSARYLHPPINIHNQFALLYQALYNAGYRVLGNDCFVRPRDSLAIAQNEGRLRRTVLNYNACNASDLLGIGPGAISQLGRHYVHNLVAVDNYARPLRRRLLPVYRYMILNSSEHLLRLLIDQVLCYHHLDVASLEARYKVSLAPFLDQAFQRLKKPCAWKLMNSGNNRRINLTAEGIFNLQVICDTLINQERERQINSVAVE